MPVTTYIIATTYLGRSSCQGGQIIVTCIKQLAYLAWTSLQAHQILAAADELSGHHAKFDR